MAITIPEFSQNRGNLRIDPFTGSTLQLPASYERDLKGCGNCDYVVLQQSMNINSNDANCKRSFVASLSISLILPSASAGGAAGDVDTLVDFLVANLREAYDNAVPCVANS